MLNVLYLVPKSKHFESKKAKQQYPCCYNIIISLGKGWPCV